MNFFDFLFIGGGGAVIGVLAHVFYLELKATGKIKPAVSATEAKIEGLGQIVAADGQAAIERFEALAKSFDPEALIQRIETTMSQAGDDIVAKVAALPAAIEAKSAATISDLEAKLAAEQADHATDLTNIDGALTAAAGA